MKYFTFQKRKVIEQKYMLLVNRDFPTERGGVSLTMRDNKQTQKIHAHTI